MKWKFKNRTGSALGLNFSGGQLHACQVLRKGGVSEVVKTTTAAMTLVLSHPDAEATGREIKQALVVAGIRERNCVVAIPSNWIMSQLTKVPELSPEDLTSFLQLEAEKSFPCDPAQLQIARSTCRIGSAAYVTQLAVRKEQLAHLTAVLLAANLRPVSFSLGLAALPAVIAAVDVGQVTVAVESTRAMLLVSVGGGIASFRTSEGTRGAETEQRVVEVGAVARELRISFEQLPTELRAGLRQLDIRGDATTTGALTERLAGWADATGLTVASAGASERPLGVQIAESIAAHWLETGTAVAEFLPLRPGRWSAMLAHYNSKRLATVGFALGGLAVLTCGAFGWQEFRLETLRAEWGAIQTPVTDLEAVQARIREYRPWYDTSFYNLSILRRVTECFPDNGSVTARAFEIHSPSIVSLSGTARDNTALLRTVDQLRKTREVQGLKIEQIHGKTPLQFTLSFRWNNPTGS